MTSARHAFGLYIPAAQEAQGVVTAALLHQYWRARSAVYLYTDLPSVHEAHAHHFAQCATQWLRAPAPATPAAGVLAAANTLVEHAAAQGIDCLTWLQPTDIPLYATTFYDSVERFAASEAPLTYAPWSARGGVPLLHGMHLHPQRLRAAGWFPLRRDAWVESWGAGDARVEWTCALVQRDWRWQERTQCLTALTFGPTGTIGATTDRTFRVRYYCPETSVVVTDDPAFWSRYAQFVRA